MSTEINFTGSLNDEDTRVALNLPRKTLTVSTGAALTSGVTAVTEAESCSYNALLDLDRKRLLHQASLVVLPSTYGEGRLFSQKPTYNTNGTFTVTRATTATRVNSAGLVELVPYNLFQYSEDFSNGYWAKTNATITVNTTTAPNFTLTADTITDNATNGQHKVQTAALSDLVTGASFVASAYVKANTATRACLYAYGTSLGVGVDLLTGNQITVSGLTNASPGQVTITNVGNGWYYIELRATVAGAFSIAIMMVNGIDFSYAGSGNSLYYWGAQLTEGTIAKPYLRTETRLNIPRIDYSLGGCPNILLEPQRTNLALYSENFADVTWAKLRTTVTQNTTNSPDNTLNADTIEVSSSGQAYLSQAVTTTVGTVNVSIYCKYINQQFLQIYSSSSGQAYANFDILNGVAGSNGTSASNVVITPAANGFYRISVALVVPAATINIRFAFVASSTSVYNPPDGVAGRQFYAWGAAIETGTTGTAGYATSYIPTTTASVTRNFDYIIRNNLVTNGIVSATQGTWFVEIRNNLPFTRDNSVSSLNFGMDGNNCIRFRHTGSGRISIEKNVGGVLTTLVSGLSTTQTMKIAFKWNGSEVETFMNGVQQTPANKTYPSTIIPQTVTTNFTNTNFGVPVTINEMAFFPTQLTNAQCIALTT